MRCFSTFSAGAAVPVYNARQPADSDQVEDEIGHFFKSISSHSKDGKPLTMT
jgi:hypothetical protein